MKIGAIVKDAVILFLITVVLGVALSCTEEATKPAIQAANENTKIKAFGKVCPSYDHSEDIKGEVVGASAGFNASLTEGGGVLLCYNSNNEVIGYIVQATSKGFGGDLNIIVGFDKNANITGVEYANTPSETPGLGMKTTERDFLDKWKNHNTNDVESVDTISGATVSSSAFKEAVKLACMFADRAKNIYGGTN